LSGTPGRPLEALAAFCVAQRDRVLPDDVRHAALRAVLDWTASTLVGAREEAAQRLTEALTGSGTGGPSVLFTCPRRADARTAALVNGTAAHAAEIDDIYRDGLYHPGAPTVAAALAVAEQQGSSGDDLLRAVSVGYEVGCRIAAAVSPEHYRFWHTTGTVGAIGSAAAAAEILRLDADRFAHALATATTMTSGLQQAFRSDSMSKPLHSGRAAEAGVLAALTAAHGITGALDVLDGPAGFAAATAGRPVAPGLLADLGDPWCVTQVTVKNHFCCGHTFAAIDAALELRAAGLRAEDVVAVEIETYTTATEVAGIPVPRTPFEAKFSLAYCVAAGLRQGSVRTRAFTEQALDDPEVRRLVGSTVLRTDADLDASYPRQRGARVRLTDTSGAQHTAERWTRKGDPDDPLTDAELEQKFSELVDPLLGEERAADLVRELRGLPGTADVRSLCWGRTDNQERS
jgi:2-methylcitrate dehydratase PrpD